MFVVISRDRFRRRSRGRAAIGFQDGFVACGPRNILLRECRRRLRWDVLGICAENNEVTMLYAILAYHVEDEVTSWTPEHDAAVVAKVIAVQEPLRASGQFGPAARLDGTRKARTLRGPGAGMVLDGPFAETKEQLLGFHLMECATEDEAIAAARKLRAVNPTAVYEIRPVKLYVPADGFGATSG
ncbi:hypothetical protein GGE24_002649 [Bradyrhizobium centrosematis]|nr:hypothetical protein [Bradyrhizobium centrosematis]MCS3773337.1 hypothetical protein [Bradyrhizobium centrosematis]